MSIQNCVYCGEEITVRSSEHVIQNGLGGLYESTDICCPKCNELISHKLDEPFIEIFNPIRGNIDGLRKKNHKNTAPSYTGTVRYEGVEYKARFSNGAVAACKELSNKYHCKPATLPLEIIGYDFKLDNHYFQQGMAKIAFNYALASGVDYDLIKPGLDVQKSGDKITQITFKYPIMPFYPLNSLDNFLELHTPLTLYHNMILFSQHSNLWCYVDLFNTFQYYVLLTDNLPNGTDIYHSYAQTVQKTDTTVPDIEINRPKDAMIYAQQYGVEPTMDAEEMARRIKTKLRKTSHKRPIEDIIEQKMETITFMDMMLGVYDHKNKTPLTLSMSAYFDDEDQLNPHTFRTITPTNKPGQIASYPEAIAETLTRNKTDLQEYTMHKFMRLNAFLCNKAK